MSRLIIVAGAGGAGKSFFMRLWEQNDKNAVRIKKFVSENRTPREIEIRTGESDLIFDQKYNPKTPQGKKWYQDNYGNLKPSPKLQFHTRQYNWYSLTNSRDDIYIYDYHGTYYEVDTLSIEKALQANKTPIVIVRKCETIKKLLKRYRDALVVYVQCVLSGQDLIKKLVSLGESEDDARRRESRNNEDFIDYISSIQQLSQNPRVVLNNFDESSTGSVFKQMLDIYNDEIKNYCFREKSIFVIQSYKNSQESIENFKMITQAAKNCLGNNTIISRADFRKDGSYMIPNHVWVSISNSDCIICDISHDRCVKCNESYNHNKLNLYQGVSPNVWLELGYAISQQKMRNLQFGERLIIICNENLQNNIEATIPPIDLGNVFNYIKYSSQADLMSKVEFHLQGMYR